MSNWIQKLLTLWQEDKPYVVSFIALLLTVNEILLANGGPHIDLPSWVIPLLAALGLYSVHNSIKVATAKLRQTMKTGK